MKIKLFSYDQLDSFTHRLSGVTKLLCFLLLTSAVMFTYDIRVIGAVLLFSILMAFISKISLKKVKPMLIYVAIFLAMNFVLTFLVAPQHGVEIYGTKHVILHINNFYEVTQEQLFYQVIKIMKYLSAIPLGFCFFLTTNPSEFASSLNSAKVPYKACTALSLTLRYFPDVQKDYSNISNAQQARGLDMSKKVKFSTRFKNTMKILIPLILSTMDRIELITNAMELRGYGKAKTRTWYTTRKLQRNDYLSIAFSVLVLLASLYIRFFINKSMYFNPFI